PNRLPRWCAARRSWSARRSTRCSPGRACPSCTTSSPASTSPPWASIWVRVRRLMQTRLAPGRAGWLAAPRSRSAQNLHQPLESGILPGDMATVAPFRGVHYPPARALQDLLAPPYDVISDAEHRKLAATHPNNIIHLTLGAPGKKRQ